VTSEIDFPECLTLWRCIGCGSMGNTVDCTGTCDFRRDYVVTAEMHADLMEAAMLAEERAADLRDFAGTVFAAPDGAALEALKPRARALVAAAPAIAAPAEDDGRAEIWRCASCGLVEAQHDCLGICIRRTGEFVSVVDHDRLAARLDALRRDDRALTTLARQIAWAAPKPGQAETMRQALAARAHDLLATA
jgi:predicted RNA-binding Zn-ribbon protein involved in translation (DUF1610 family)